MRLVGLGLLVHGAVAHVLHAQRAGNYQHLVERATVFGLQNHAAHARVQRQFGQGAAYRCQLVVVIDRAQLSQQLVAIRHRPALWRLDKRKVFNRAKVQRLHAQDHTGQ